MYFRNTIVLLLVLLGIVVADSIVHHNHQFAPIAHHHHHILTGVNSVKGLSHAELIKLYDIPWSLSAGAGKTVAVVIAYGSSIVEGDLASFTKSNELPPCTTENGCYKRVNATGGTHFPKEDNDWAGEADLDIQTIHAVAPGAKKILVTANSASFADMFAAVDYAAQVGDYVSMSWGAQDRNANPATYEPIFAKYPRVTFVASSGDTGADIDYPSTSNYVIAVGGTTIDVANNGSLATESGWNGSGGGCSTVLASPEAQQKFSEYPAQNCAGKRSVPDVAYDADPYSGVPIFVLGRVEQIGGTSLSAPLFSARAAIRGDVIKHDYIYGDRITFRDITVGGTRQNQCRVGLDKVTGRGVWVGA